MQQHSTESASSGVHDEATRSGSPVLHDSGWRGERRTAIGIAALLLTSLLALDASLGRLDALRAALWTGLACLLLGILLPPRVSAGPGLLTVRGLLVERSVRTGSLVSVRRSGGVTQRLVLKDTHGAMVEIDPAVLVRNPALWHRLDTDALTSVRRGTLLRGTAELRRLAAHVDRETARTVFQVSGLT